MELNFKKLGSGQPLIILHGLMGMLDNWQTPAKYFAPHFEVYLVDQRNHGRSPQSEEFNYQVLADDLFEFIYTHHLHDVNIIGHSMGGKTAMKFAQNNPHLVDKLIVADIAPKSYPVHHHEILEALVSADLNKLKSRGEVEDHLMDKLKVKSIVHFLLKNLYWKNKGELAWRINLPVIKKNIEIIGAATTDAVYDQPTLFLKGEKSHYIQDEDLELINDYFPQAKVLEPSNAGHWVHAENLEDFVKYSLDFLDS